MSKTILYPDVPRVRQSFKGHKVCVLPNQSMTLQEILRRFVKRESLPQMMDGIYVESDYDLEKLAKADRIEQDEILAEIKQDVAKKRKKAQLAQAPPPSIPQVDPKQPAEPKA